MSKKLFLLPFLFFAFCLTNVQAQTADELKAQKTVKQEQLDALQAEVAALQAEIDALPGWDIGGVGVIGFNALANNNWFAINTPNSANNSLGLGFSGYAKYDEPKYFWNNLLNINVSQSNNFSDKADDNTKSTALTNGLDLASLFGYKIAPKWAISAELKWLSSLVEFDAKDLNDPFDNSYKPRLNNPGQATLSAGVTWLPIKDLVVIIHPLAYQKNWPGELISAAGAKIGATYAAEIIPGVSWSSNLSAFIPYGGAGDVSYLDGIDGVSARPVNYETGDLVNWTWINGFSFSVWKGIGVSFNLGLKGDKQVADLGRLNNAVSTSVDPSTIDVSDSPLQSYYSLGLSYTF